MRAPSGDTPTTVQTPPRPVILNANSMVLAVLMTSNA